MDENLTYLAESKVSVNNVDADNSGKIGIPPVVMRCLELTAGEDYIVWYLDRDTNQVVPRRKEGE